MVRTSARYPAAVIYPSLFIILRGKATRASCFVSPGMVSGGLKPAPPELSGIYRGRGIADCIANLTSAFEDFKHRGDLID